MEILPLSMCRICLADNVPMYLVVNRNLHKLYEKLTNIPFVTEDRKPIVACSLCCNKLKKSFRLMRQCLDAKELLPRMSIDDHEPKPLVNPVPFGFRSGFTITPVEQINIVDRCQTESIAIKQELPADCEGLEDIKEDQSDDLENDVPILEFKIDVEEAVEEPNRKRRVVDTNKRGEPLETPLLVSRERKRPRSELAWEQPAEPLSPSLSMVPSPALFVACETATPPPSSLVPPPPAPPSQYRRNLGDADVLKVLHYGSDLSSDESDEENVVSPRLPRTLQSIMETPLDEDFEDFEGFEDGGGDDAAAEDVPPTATDQPRRWFDFEWKDFPNPPIQPESRRETFSQSNVGPTTPRDDPCDIFIDIWDRPIMEHIASETNKYAQLVAGEADNLHASSPMRRWRPTDPEELYTFFGLLLAMGVVVKTRLEEYWSTTADIFASPDFSAYMSMNRFILLCKCLHFNSIDMCALDQDPSVASLYKILPILSHLNKKFQKLYTPSQNITIDQSLIPNKTAKRDIESYEICESQTGYLWRFEIHTNISQLPPKLYEDPMEYPTPTTVLRLTQGLEHKGYTLWMDNLYNSPCLARRLKSLGFDCVGTLRTDRFFVPQALYLMHKWDLFLGAICGLTSGDVDIVVWRGSNRVATISTYHGMFVHTARGSTKPTVLWDYNTVMERMDYRDQLLAMYPVGQILTMVWYKKLFRRLLNVSVYNSFVIHQHSSSLSHRDFRTTLIKSLLSRHRPLRIPIPIPTIATTQNRPLDVAPQRDGEPFLATVHRIEEFDVDPNNARRPRRQCIICKRKVQSFCVGCNKPLCIKNCFLLHHTI